MTPTTSQHTGPTPTYYVRHPDDTYSVADPQPVAVQINASDPVADEDVPDFRVRQVEASPIESGHQKEQTIYCKEKAKPGGCQLHNLQCGWPLCNKRPRKGQQ